VLTRTFAIAATLWVAGPASAQVVLFSDDFAAGASPLWGNEVGSWVAAGGVYTAQLPSNSPPTYSGLPFALGFFTFDVDINNVQDGGVWLRSANNANGVLLVTGGAASGFTGLYWHTVVGGTVSPPLNLVNGLFTPGVSDPHLRIEVSGDDYAVFVDGNLTPATTLTTNLFPTGRAGLYDFSGQTFDNVLITVPEPSALALLGLVAGCGLLHRRRR
jgi:hypothetical protein